jgi:hypothetical protein
MVGVKMADWDELDQGCALGIALEWVCGKGEAMRISIHLEDRPRCLFTLPHAHTTNSPQTRFCRYCIFTPTRTPDKDPDTLNPSYMVGLQRS